MIFARPRSGQCWALVALLAALVCGARALPPVVPATPPTKRVVVQAYFNRVFECRFPAGWALETNPDVLEDAKTKFVLARRPGAQSQMSVQFFSYLHPKFPTAASYLKANAGGAKVARRRISKHRKTKAWVFKRQVSGGIEAVVVRRLTRKGSYCVFRYYADSRLFEVDKRSFNKLVKSFQYRLNRRARSSGAKAGAAGAAKGGAVQPGAAKAQPAKGLKRLQSNDRFKPRTPDSR